MELRIDTDHGVIAPYAMMILLSFLAGTGGLFLLNLRRGIRRQTAFWQMLLSPLLSLCGGIALTFITSGGRQLGLSSLGGLCGMYAACALAARLSKQRGCVIRPGQPFRRFHAASFGCNDNLRADDDVFYLIRSLRVRLLQGAVSPYTGVAL
jgi:hypothetical protein